MYLSDQIIDNAIEIILNTREFCGNEMLAVHEYCADENIEDWLRVYRIANFRAIKKWNQYKKQAGVNPKYCF